MKDVKFFRLDKNNLELVNDIDIDNEKILKKDLEQFIKNEANYCFVGLCENKVISFLYGYGMTRPDGKAMFYIHSVDVIQEYQNQGIGTKLMEFVLKYIKNENKYYKFFVLTENDNVKACKVYQKYGEKNEQVMFSNNI